MKMYIMIRDDLSKSQQGVQGGHALAEFMLSYPDIARQWNNGVIVYVKADIDTISSYVHKLADTPNISIASFKEPDIGNQLTAIAAYGPEASPHFSGFKLM